MGRRVYVGTSGWNYDDWKKNFYPEDVPKTHWLEHYAKEFDSVEVNGSFYKLPRKETLEKWVETVPKDFRFSMKMWRGITHYKKLKDTRDKLDTFFDLLSVIPTRHRGVVLVQVPPNQHKDLAKLEKFLNDAKKAMGKAHWRLAFEPRHESWNDEETRRLLDKKRVALVVHDMKGKGDVDEPNHAAFMYVRRHGPGGDTSKKYNESTLKKDAQMIKQWKKDHPVFVYYNNDHHAYAPLNAHQLEKRVDGGGH